MQHLKRTLAVCTATVLCLSSTFILPAGAADETLTYDVWQYTIGSGAASGEENVITLVNCDKSVNEVAIPDEIDGIPVTGLYDAIFADCNDLTTITVGANVRNLDGFVFGGCDSLMNILTVEGSSYTSRDGVLFKENDLVCCPVARTGVYTIPEDTETIRSRAFYTCAKLEGVIVPASVTEIQTTAFLECRNLKNVTIDEENPNYICRDGVIFNKAGTQLVTCTSAKEGTYTVPEHVKGMQNMAFYGCSGLTDVTLPEGMTSVGMFTFAGCLSLKSVSIPVSMQEIGMSAFYACDSLTDVYYGGTEAQWQAVSIETGNENLTNAVIHFNGAEPEYILGDVNNDSRINASDAAMVLIAAAQIGAGDTPDLTEAQRKAADVNQDDKINASDAAVILIYAAAVGAGDTDVKIEDFVNGIQ